MNMSLRQIIRTGGIAMWIILGGSVVAIAVALERLSAVWADMDRARALAEAGERCLTGGGVAEARAACERSRSPLGDVFLVGFERLGRGSKEALEAAVDR